MRHVALALAVALVGCIVPSSSEVQAHNCLTSVNNFDTGYCFHIIPQPDQLQTVEYMHHQISSSCPDAQSQARLHELDTTCVDAYRSGVAMRASEDSAIKTKYAKQVIALKADLAYRTAFDGWRSALDEASIAQHDYEDRGQPIRSSFERKMERTKQQLRRAEDRLRDVISGHGIDPQYASVLGVW